MSLNSSPTLVGGLVLLSLAVASCTAPPIAHEYEFSPDNQFQPETHRRVLVAPLNSTLDVPTGLEAGRAPTMVEIQNYLEEKGLEVEIAPSPAFTRALNKAARRAQDASRAGASKSVSESVPFADLIPGILSDLESNATLLVAPNLVIREGEYNGGSSIEC